MKFMQHAPKRFGAKFAIVNSLFYLLILLYSCNSKRIYTISPRTDNESAVIKKIVLLYQFNNPTELKSNNIKIIRQAIKYSAKKHGLSIIEPDFDSLKTINKASFNILKNEILGNNNLCISEIDSSNHFISNFKTPAYLYNSKVLISPRFSIFQNYYNTPFFAIIKLDLNEKKLLNRIPENRFNYEITFANVSTGAVFYNEKKSNKGLLNTQQLRSIFYESLDVLKFGNY